MVRLPGLETDILSLIKDIYCCEFNHNIEVFKREDEYFTDPETNETYLLNPGSYILRLHVHDNRWCPMQMSLQCDTDLAFLDYIEQELKSRNLIRSEHYKINLDGSDESKEGI